MTEREKLIELMCDERNPIWYGILSQADFEKFADYLLTNGVKIPVRCCECKHLINRWTTDKGKTFGLCDKHDATDMPETEFCSFGE